MSDERAGDNPSETCHLCRRHLPDGSEILLLDGTSPAPVFCSDVCAERFTWAMQERQYGQRIEAIA